MLKVLCVVDKVNTAIDRLAQGVAKYHDNLNYVVVDVHPKRPDPEQLMRFEKEAIDADIIDWQYFRTAELLRSRYEWLKDKKQVLTHNNPYSIHESDWNTYDINIGNNKEVYKNLQHITSTPLFHIPLAVDSDFWTYNFDWQPNNNVIMVANRIEGKKGILPIAEVCQKLNLNFHLVGAISDWDYFQKINQIGCTFHQEISDEGLKSLYYRSTVQIGNSVDEFETGPLPMVEAMLCGTPVFARKVGHVPELNNGENMVLYEGDNEDVEAIAEKLSEMLADKKKLESMRDKAWNSAKGWNFERRAYMYQKVYRQLMSEELSVSVVVPINENKSIIIACLDAIANQNYKNVEIIVVDDNNAMSSPIKYVNQDMIEEFREFVNIPVRYINSSGYVNNTDAKDYGLARARNLATIEATGEVMIYCDQRMVMAPDAIEKFVANLKPQYWLYGNKGVKKEFIENFSCAFRDDVINAGMFCERIDEYGGQSQEIRSRLQAQGILTEYVESAKANPIGKSSNRNRKRASIIRMKNRLAKMYEL